MELKNFSTESFLTFLVLQYLVSYKRVSYKKNTCINRKDYVKQDVGQSPYHLSSIIPLLSFEGILPKDSLRFFTVFFINKNINVLIFYSLI